MQKAFCAGLVEDAMTAIISQNVNAEMTLLKDSMDRLVMGSPHPLVPVQPTQVNNLSRFCRLMLKSTCFGGNVHSMTFQECRYHSVPSRLQISKWSGIVQQNHQ